MFKDLISIKTLMIRKQAHTARAKSHKILSYLIGLQIKQVPKKQYNSWKAKKFKISSDIMERKIYFMYIWKSSRVKLPSP